MLGVSPLHLLGEKQLAKLAADRPRLSFRRVEHVVLHHLLGDGRAAERPGPMRQVIGDRDRQPPVVHAGVVVEGPVLGVDRRPLQVDADLVQGNHRAILVIERFDEVAVAVEDACRLAEVGGLDRVDRRQVAGEVIDDANRRARPDQAHRRDDDQHNQGKSQQPVMRLALLSSATSYTGARPSLVRGQAGPPGRLVRRGGDFGGRSLPQPQRLRTLVRQAHDRVAEDDVSRQHDAKSSRPEGGEAGHRRKRRRRSAPGLLQRALYIEDA